MRTALRLLSGLALVFLLPLAAVAQTTETTEPYSGEDVTDTSLAGDEIVTVVDGLTVTFSVAGAEDCTWDFGDGSTADGNPVTHTYADEGTYDVSATCGSVQFATDVVVGDIPFTGIEMSTYLLWGGGLVLLGGSALVTARRLRS